MEKILGGPGPPRQRGPGPLIWRHIGGEGDKREKEERERQKSGPRFSSFSGFPIHVAPCEWSGTTLTWWSRITQYFFHLYVMLHDCFETMGPPNIFSVLLHLHTRLSQKPTMPRNSCEVGLADDEHRRRLVVAAVPTPAPLLRPEPL